MTKESKKNLIHSAANSFVNSTNSSHTAPIKCLKSPPTISMASSICTCEWLNTTSRRWAHRKTVVSLKNTSKVVSTWRKAIKWKRNSIEIAFFATFWRPYGRRSSHQRPVFSLTRRTLTTWTNQRQRMAMRTSSISGVQIENRTCQRKFCPVVALSSTWHAPNIRTSADGPRMDSRALLLTYPMYQRQPKRHSAPTESRKFAGKIKNVKISLEKKIVEFIRKKCKFFVWMSELFGPGQKRNYTHKKCMK